MVDDLQKMTQQITNFWKCPRYMYKNAMSMEDTVFTMNVDDNGNMSGSVSASLGSTNPIMER